MAHVIASADGYKVVATGATFTSDLAALDAACAALNAPAKQPRFRDEKTGEPNGQLRWLHACSNEDVPIDGIRIDAQAQEEMAASLNSNPRSIPVNGGPPPDGLMPSKVHGDATDSATLANGWAQWGITIRTPTTTNLYLFTECLPHIAREIDVGRLAEGSVHFGYGEIGEGGVPRGCELIAHAFTNDPAVKTLSPSNSIRTRTASRSFSLTGAMRAAPRGIQNMAKTPKTAARMTLKDAESAIASLFPDVKPDDLGTEMLKIAASHAEGMKPAPEVEAAKPDEKPEAAKAVERAEGDPTPDAPADGAEAAAALDLMRDLLGKPEASLADCIDLLKKQQDPIKAAIAAGPDAGAQEDADGAAQAEAARTSRMDMVALRSEVATLRANDAKREAELTALRATALRTRVEGEIRSSLTVAKREMGDDLIAALAADLCAVPDDAARARHLARAVPGGAPTGTVMPTGNARAAADATLTIKTATDSFLDEARKTSRKGEPPQHLRARAQKLARAAHPHLFEAAASADSSL